MQLRAESKLEVTLTRTDVIVEGHEFCEGKSSQNQSQQNSNGPAPNSDGFISIPDGIENELPFN